MKRTIRLTESELRRMISESVRRVINEEYTLPNGSKVNGYGVTTPSGRNFNLKKGPRNFNLKKNCEVLPNGTEVCNNGEVTTPSGRNFNLKKESINRIVSETVRRVLDEATDYADYHLTHAPRTKFARDDGGKAAMDTLDYINDGGMAPEDTSLAWDWGHDGMEGMQDTYHKLKSEREMRRASNRRERNNMRRALDAADSRPLHRKGSLNREF